MDLGAKGVSAAKAYGETMSLGFDVRTRVAKLNDSIRKGREKDEARRALIASLTSVMSKAGQNLERSRMMRSGAEALGIEYQSRGILEDIGIVGPDTGGVYGGYSGYGLLDVGRTKMHDPAALEQAIERARIYYTGR